MKAWSIQSKTNKWNTDCQVWQGFQGLFVGLCHVRAAQGKSSNALSGGSDLSSCVRLGRRLRRCRSFGRIGQEGLRGLEHRASAAATLPRQRVHCAVWELSRPLSHAKQQGKAMGRTQSLIMGAFSAFSNLSLFVVSCHQKFLRSLHVHSADSFSIPIYHASPQLLLAPSPAFGRKKRSEAGKSGLARLQGMASTGFPHQK